MALVTFSSTFGIGEKRLQVAKTPRPNWSDRRKRWMSRIGTIAASGQARQVFFPLSIGKGDEARAWEWMKSYQAKNGELNAPLENGTVADLADRFVEMLERQAKGDGLTQDQIDNAKTNLANAKTHLAFLCHALGAHPFDKVARRDLQKMVDRIVKSAKYKPHYVGHIVTTVAALFKWPRDQGLIAANPAEGGLKKPAAPRTPERFAERAEAAVWIRWCDGRAKAAFPKRRSHSRQFVLMQRVMIRSGARPKELCQSRWEDVR